MTTKTKQFEGWAIDRDYLAEENSRVGYGQTQEDLDRRMPMFNEVCMSVELKSSQVQDPVRFRLLDDDGEVYYGGAVTASWVLEGENGYEIDRFGTADAGATESQFRAVDLAKYDPRFVEKHREFGAVVEGNGQEWVIVYG